MRIRKAPKTEEVYMTLKRQIAAGEYPGGMLPVEPKLAEELQVSRKTLRSALARLALENLIVRIKGDGTYINRGGASRGKILVLVRNEEDLTNPDRYILPGIEQEAVSLNLQVETTTSLPLTAGRADEAVRNIRRKNYLGVLSMNANFTGREPLIGILKKTGLPVLLMHAYPSDAEKTGFAAMGTDYRAVMRDGLQYLSNLGHRRITYLACREYRIDKKSYFKLLEELGLDTDPKLYIESDSYHDYDRIMEVLRGGFDGLRKKPTAVFCFSDYFALCLYDYLNERRIRIPDDIAVLSIGGMIGCDFLTPPLSAIDFDCAGIGRTAVRTLMDMKLKNETARPFTITPHYLTERESTRKNAISRMPATFLHNMEEQKNVQYC